MNSSDRQHKHDCVEIIWTHDGSTIQIHGTVRALVVDDSPVHARVVTWILARIGFEVHTVSNGQAAIEELRKADYALVIMDCQMPVMDGLEATMKLRSIEARTGKHSIIIGYSATSNELTCLAAGMDGFISKPTHQDEIRKKVVRLYRERAA